MTDQEENTDIVVKTPKTVEQWQLDLDQVGFIRRMLMARKWYGGDWWFVLISAILLLFIILLGVFPGWFAPYNPRAEVGSSLLAPGESPAEFLLVIPKGSAITSLKDVGTQNDNIGYVIGSPASQALRDAIEKLNADPANSGTNFQPRPRRYETIDLVLADLAAGKLNAVVASQDELGNLLDTYSSLEILRSLTGEITKGFALGTNQLGQDVLSRIIWGTRIAIIVGMSSALVSILVGVPLGLFSGFVSGPIDRVLTLVMDSLYTFPGLILAIAIAAILGPGIGNVIVAIAVLYVPTYFRIVRGQTLSVKQELYVEAARSLGAKPITLLWKYIFPNVIPSIVIIFSVNVADAILTQAGLSFLGLGLPPDIPDWGIDLARGRDYLRRAWWLITL